MLQNRNEDKTQQKIIDIQKDIVENQNKSEKFQNDLKQMDVDARKLLDEHKQAMVWIYLFSIVSYSVTWLLGWYLVHSIGINNIRR